MKNTDNYKKDKNYSKFQNKPLVASKGFKKFYQQEKQHFDKPYRKHRNDDFDDFDDFDDEEAKYGKFKNFERINRRNETAYSGKHKSGKNIKPANVCVIANFRSPTFTGRVGTALLDAAKSQNLLFAASERRSYAWQKDFILPETVTKTLEQPDASKSRCYVSNLYSFSQEHAGPQDSWIASFDPMNPDMAQLKRLHRAGLVIVPSEKHAQACKKAGIKPQNIKIAPMPVNTDVFNPKAVCPVEYANKKDHFRIITSGNPLNRKGLEDVLTAYIKEFKPTEKVELIIKLTHLPKIKKDFAYEVLDFRKKLGALNSMFAKVIVIDHTLSDEDYAGLLASADVYAAGNLVFNSAINVREAVACGLHVIGADYLNSISNLPMNSIIPVKTKVFEMPKGELYADSPSVKVNKLDPQGLSYALRRAFNAKDSLRGRKAGIAASFKNSISWEELARMVQPKPKEENYQEPKHNRFKNRE
jgi:glycosyltransferase involved in cell wall biosynthesis